MEIQIDLEKCTLRELLDFGAGQMSLENTTKMLDRVVVGGIDALTGAQVGVVMKALREKIVETLNPKETA